MDGKLVHTLEAPDAMTDFEHQAVNTYFSEGGKFVPTGITHVDGMLYVTTGYSDLDYILGAKLTSLDPFEASWYPLAFGGKGDEPGQFGTGHHITVPYGTNRLDASDRANAEVERYSQMAPTWKHFHLLKDHSRAALTTRQGMLSSRLSLDRIKRKVRRSTYWRETISFQLLC